MTQPIILHALQDRLRPSDRMPVMFPGHGNPLYTITENPWAEGWEAIGLALPPPRAILCISDAFQRRDRPWLHVNAVVPVFLTGVAA
jgi:4,5-DOPA dioxygenase extradiol